MVQSFQRPFTSDKMDDIQESRSLLYRNHQSEQRPFSVSTRTFIPVMACLNILMTSLGWTASTSRGIFCTTSRISSLFHSLETFENFTAACWTTLSTRKMKKDNNGLTKKMYYTLPLPSQVQHSESCSYLAP